MIINLLFKGLSETCISKKAVSFFLYGRQNQLSVLQ